MTEGPAPGRKESGGPIPVWTGRFRMMAGTQSTALSADTHEAMMGSTSSWQANAVTQRSVCVCVR